VKFTPLLTAVECSRLFREFGLLTDSLVTFSFHFSLQERLSSILPADAALETPDILRALLWPEADQAIDQ
jgi:hypothetical protein